MKKILIALVAMFVMTASVHAQSDNGSASFDRVAGYLELTIEQVEPFRTAMAQFERSMEAYYQLQDPSKGTEAWEKILARHKSSMKKILTGKQYDKYVQTLDLTVKNTAERMMQEATAQK